VIFNERKLIYKNFDQKTSVDSFYQDDEMNDSFQSVRDENDQSVRKSLRNENFGQENRNVEENVISSAESLQSVGDSQETAYQVENQVASTHAVEVEIISADNSDAEHFVLVNELEDQFEAIVSEMINQVDQSVVHQTANQAELVADNQLISEKHNSLILNYSRSKIRHDYKQLHRRDFVKSTKFESRHELIISKTYEQVINGSQAKE
jgi:hypothetical protein